MFHPFSLIASFIKLVALSVMVVALAILCLAPIALLFRGFGGMAILYSHSFILAVVKLISVFLALVAVAIFCLVPFLLLFYAIRSSRRRVERAPSRQSLHEIDLGVANMERRLNNLEEILRGQGIAG